MSLARVKKLLKEKEGIQLEFKEAKAKLPSNLFESVCAMLNRNGGDILLGVKDNGEIVGIDDTKVDTLKTNLVNLSNNQEKIDPPYILFPQVYNFDGKNIIHIPVPLSSQVHRTNNIVYDRSNDGDFKIQDPDRITNMVLGKRSYFSESEVFPNVTMDDFDPDTFEKVRKLFKIQNKLHPWNELSNEQILKKAGLWRLDKLSLIEGYTLAAILLFGKEEVIKSLLPYYKVDVLVRKDDLYRYDDRDYIECNLIDAYDRIMDFVKKHLPDNFYLEGDIRLSLREKIFREIAANILVHREYRNATPTILVIYRDRVETQNANNPHGEGRLLPDNFTPFPKNPFIAKFFARLGRVDELGSGVINVNKYINFYAPGRKPEFIEEKIFKTIIPVGKESVGETGGLNGGLNGGEKKMSIEVLVSNILIDGVNDGLIDGVSDGVRQELIKIVNSVSIKEGIGVKDIISSLDIAKRTLERYIKTLRVLKIIEYKGSSKTGGYYLTDKVKEQIKK